jgi:hypothetical protein
MQALREKEMSRDEPPNVGVSRAAGNRRKRTNWRQGMTLKSRAQVAGCASSVGLHALLGCLAYTSFQCYIKKAFCIAYSSQYC